MLRAGPLEGVDPEEQLDEVVIHRRRGRLNKKDLFTPDRLEKLDCDLAIREPLDIARANLKA